jgi:hydrogenase maturation factor
MTPTDVLPVGKLPAEILERILARLPPADRGVVIGPRVGEDAAVLDVGDRYLVVATDPVTFATDSIGWYCVNVNANDVAVLGARPRFFFAVLLLPERSATAAMAENIIADVAETCRLLGISLCGGHTEVTAGLNRPILIGQMIGEVAKDRVVRKDRLEAGDRVLLTRGAAIEGTALLARDRREALEGRLDAEMLSSARDLLFDPGISIVEAAMTAVAAGPVHAMHDPTEGGIATGLWELARAGGLGLRVRASAIPVLPETQGVCATLGLDAMRLLASGALLVAADPRAAERIVDALAARGIPAAEIGHVVPSGEGIEIETDGVWTGLEPAERDEIARLAEMDR